MESEDRAIDVDEGMWGVGGISVHGEEWETCSSREYMRRSTRESRHITSARVVGGGMGE